MRENSKETQYILLLIALIIFHLVNNYLWLRQDKVLLADDPYWHHLLSLRIYRFLEKGEFFLHPLKCLKLISARSNQYGIFVQLITAPFYFIFGIGQDQAAMVTAGVFLTVLISSIYGITKRLTNPKGGILAAFIISMYPVIFNHSRMYMLDLPLTALVSLSIYFLIHYELFRKNKYIFLFLLVFLLALLTKINFILFIFTPLLIILSKVACRSRRKTARSLFGLILVFIILYFIKGKRIFDWLMIFFSLFKPAKVVKSLPNISHYLLRLVDNGISFILTVTFAIAVAYFIKSRFRNKSLLLFSLILPLFILSLFASFNDPLHMVRYSLPLLVFSAIITGMGLIYMHPAMFRRSFISLVVIFSLMQFFAISWGITYLPKDISLRKDAFCFSLFRQNLHIPPARNRFSHPTMTYWDANQLWERIEEINDSKDKLTIVVLDPLCEIFYPLHYRATVEEKPINVITVEMIPPSKKTYRRKFSLSEYILGADYVIATNRPKSPLLAPFYIEPEKREAESVFYHNIQSFALIEKFNLPNKIEVFLYKNLKAKN